MEKPDDKGFLSRWSARKAEARAKTGSEDKQPAPEQLPEQQVQPPVDPAELPPIDELTEDSDYTPFLRKGVPETMRKAALRKLWVTEPSVVNYRPLVEYAWHENEPGFGPLLPTDNVQDMLERIFSGSPDAPKEQEEAAATPETSAADAPALPTPEAGADIPVETNPAAEEPAAEPLAELPRRRHGGALPS